MTSKNLFFKLMKEDLKRKVWAVGLAFLSFFFWMPVMTAMRVSDVYQMYDRWIKNGTTFGEGITAESRLAEKLLDVVADTVGMGNPLNACTIAVAAVVLASTGFMYVHSRKQMDFYHSIPVRREQIFAVKYLNGILIIFSTYLVNMLLAFGVLAVNRVDLSVVVPAGLTAFAVHMGGFLINYGLMVIAVMLTGNFFISILGGIVLFAYVPAIIALAQGLMYLFFETVNFRGVDTELIYVRTSPIAYYVYVVVEGTGMDMAKYGSLMGRVGACLGVGAVMAIIAMFLYKKRPSESAGKSMAFKVSKTPIKILLVVPITIAAAVLFWNIYYSLPWAVFGFVIGVVVTHCIVEIIYHFEFRKLFSNLHHMGISAVLALIIIAVFRFDLLGYDTYLPKEKDFESASVYAGNLQDWNDYGLPYQYDNGYGTSRSWRYVQGNEYVAENMKVTDYAVIERLAVAGIGDAKRVKELRYSKQDDTAHQKDYWTTLEVGYRLNNGKKAYRNYTVNVTELREVFDELYAMEEYKCGTNPILSYEVDNITGIYEAKRSEIQQVDADEEMIAEILEAYKEEAIALTLDERAVETPVTSLRFLTIAEKDYISQITKERSPNYVGDFRLSDMNQVNFFPVYPSFTKTLALLKECGIDDFGPVSVDDVDRIEIYSDYYTDEQAYYDAHTSYYEERVYAIVNGVEAAEAYPVTVSSQDGLRTITLKVDGSDEMRTCMEEVLSVAYDHDLVQLNGLQSMEYGISVRVYMKSDVDGISTANQEFIPYLFKPDETPQFVKEAFKYDTFESKNVNHGLNLNIEK